MLLRAPGAYRCSGSRPCLHRPLHGPKCGAAFFHSSLLVCAPLHLFLTSYIWVSALPRGSVAADTCGVRYAKLALASLLFSFSPCDSRTVAYVMFFSTSFPSYPPSSMAFCVHSGRTDRGLADRASRTCARLGRRICRGSHAALSVFLICKGYTPECPAA